MRERNPKVKEGDFFSSIKETVGALSFLHQDDLAVLVRQKSGFKIYGLTKDNNEAECMMIGAQNLGHEAFLGRSVGLKAKSSMAN